MGALIDRLIASSLRHRVAVLVLTAMVACGGVWAFVTLNTDAFPDLTPNQVLVMTTVPGLSPTEVEQQVTYPMEIAMLGLPRTVGVRAESKAGLSVVTVTFADNVDFYFARAQVQQRMQDARSALPANADAMIGPPATAMGEVFHYLVEADSTGSAASDSLRLIELTNVQEYIIRPLLRTVTGVADVNTWGGYSQQFEVLADPTRLAGFGVTLSDVRQALAANNASFGGGYIEDRGERFTLRGIGRISDTTDIANVVVRTNGATPVYVRDVARVVVGPAQRYGAVTRDARGEALSAAVLMIKGSNGRDVVARVQLKLDEIRPVLPKGITIRPYYSQGDVVDRTSATVFRNLIEGALLVVLVLLLFLRNLRASLLTASVIPLALLIAFLAMRYGGMTANLMSLGALDFGLLVDASVVVIENIVRRLRGEPGASAERRTELVREATAEVGKPVVFGVAIILAVYLPVGALEGLERKMFIPMAFTVCAAVLGSLFLALTYVPSVAASILTPERIGSGESEHEQEGRWFERLRDRYQRLLGAALARPGRVVAGAVTLLAAALISVPYLGSEFMPKLDEGSLLIETRRVPSTSLPQGIAVSTEVERILHRFPEVKGVVTNLGRPHEATETMALFAGDVYLALRPHSEWEAESLDELISRMDSALADVPGLEYEFSAPMRMRLGEVVSGVKTDLGVKLFGDSLPLLEERAEAVRALIATVPGAADVSVGVGAGAMQLEVVLNRAAIARYGLNVADVQEAVEGGVGGSEASQIIDGRRRFPIVVRLDVPYRSTPEAVGNTLIRTPAGGTVTLSQVAAVRLVEGPETINHENGQRYVVVQSNVRGRDLGSFVAEVRQQIQTQITLPAGYYAEYGGQFENQARATKRLSLIVPLVLLAIGGLLYASFGAMQPVLLVMLNVPFALVGGVAALWLRGLHLNLSALVGMIAVFGVAILNGLVLISYTGQLRAAGRSALDAIREAALVRLRPVLATATVAAVGFLPMALSRASGAEVQRPLATVVIGGVISSTLLTLVVLPAVYGWVNRRRGK